MGPTRTNQSTSTQRKATSVKKKYGKRMTPEKKERLRKVLFSVTKGKKSLRKAADDNNLLYSFLYRRYSEEVDL